MSTLPNTDLRDQISSSTLNSEAMLTLVDYANIFESVAIGLSALAAAYFGVKGIGSLLQEEDIKERFKIVRKKNFELTSFSLNVLYELDKMDDGSDFIITDDQISKLQKISMDLEQESHGSGSVPQTFCHLISAILNEIKPNYKANNASLKLSSHRLYAFFYDSVSSMIFYLDHNIEVPRKKRISMKNRFFSWWYMMPGKQELAAGSFGVFLSSRSHAIAAIHKVLERINAETIYYALLFKHSRNNSEAIKKSLELDAYIPPSFVVKDREDGENDIFLYGTRLYLVKTDTITDIDTKETHALAYYHDLDRSTINLKEGSGLKSAIRNSKDEISGKRFFDIFDNYTAYGDGSFRVKIPISWMNRDDRKFKHAVKKKLGRRAILSR